MYLHKIMPLKPHDVDCSDPRALVLANLASFIEDHTCLGSTTAVFRSPYVPGYVVKITRPTAQIVALSSAKETHLTEFLQFPQESFPHQHSVTTEDLYRYQTWIATQSIRPLLNESEKILKDDASGRSLQIARSYPLKADSISGERALWPSLKTDQSPMREAIESGYFYEKLKDHCKASFPEAVICVCYVQEELPTLSAVFPGLTNVQKTQLITDVITLIKNLCAKNHALFNPNIGPNIGIKRTFLPDGKPVYVPVFIDLGEFVRAKKIPLFFSQKFLACPNDWITGENSDDLKRQLVKGLPFQSDADVVALLQEAQRPLPYGLTP